MTLSTQSQDLSSHKWNERVILLLTESITDGTYQKQISELENHLSGLKDRKLIIYHVQAGQIKKGLSGTKWEKNESLFDTYKKTNSGFEFVLIGLDNGVKFRESKLVSCEELFSIIDAMPMRIREMRNKD